ncbi:MAG TPA: hypothetical protein VJH03_20970 [Blastocatellia bacterium]|nr:hypothetical protein [Blastocatellia bacterium]
MPNKRTQPLPKTEEDELFEALLGPDEEIDLETAKDVLKACGVDSSDLVSKLMSRVEAGVRELRSKSKSVPVPVENALRNLRRAEEKKSESAGVDPDCYLANLLSGTLPSAGAEAVSSLRGRKLGEKVSSKDKEILDSLKSKLDEGDTGSE